MAIVAFAPLGARAADLPPPSTGPAVYAPPPAYRAVANWNGFYLGGNVGVDLARDKSTFSVAGVPFATVDNAVFGAAAGGQAGYNWQFGALVLGAEGDFNWSNAKGSISAQCAICGPVTNATRT
jgi:outer membrane immunogenic protein